MKTTDISAMRESVMRRTNSRVKRTRSGIELSAFPRNGSVMEIQTVLMELMRMQHSITARLHRIAVRISSDVKMDVVSIR